MSDDETSNVIPLFPMDRIPDVDEEQNPLTVRTRYESGCEHATTVIDERLRKIFCKVCAAQLDPVEVLIDLSRVYRYRDYKLGALLDAEARNSQREIEKIVRARVRHKVHEEVSRTDDKCWRCEDFDRREKHHKEMIAAAERQRAVVKKGG